MLSVNASSTNTFVLSSLRQTNSELATTQNRIASGYKVASAKDNASVWSTAQGLRKDIAAEDTIGSSIALAKGQASAAYEALTSITEILTKMETKAAELGSDNSSNPQNVAVQKELSYYQAQILAIAKSASIQGVNFLTSADATEASATIAQDQGNPITMKFSMLQIVDTDNTPTDGILTNGAANAFGNIVNSVFNGTSTGANKTTFISAIGTAKTSLATYTARVSSYADSLDNQLEFTTRINDIRKTALSALVDADMEKESAKVSALQVKQQLAFQALAIGNNSTQNILRLFQ